MKPALLQRRARYVFFAAVVFGLLGVSEPAAVAQRAYYRFTIIADTQTQFPYQSLTLFPCQNNADRVGFDAVLTGGVQGMFTRLDQSGVDSVADTGTTPYEDIGDCSMNGNGLVLFQALQHLSNEFAQVLLLGGGNNLLTLLTAKADGEFKNFSGYQLNQQGKAVVEADRADGSGSVILTNGPLTGLRKDIADTSQKNSQFVDVGSSPSINVHNTVAFTAKQKNGNFAIITIADDGTEAILIDSTGPFAGFDDIDLNDNGSLAFDGHQQGGLGGVWRLDTTASGTSITKITDANATGSSFFTAVSLNDAGQVAYSFLDEISETTSTVGLGNGKRFIFGPSPIVAGPGTIAFGDFVSSAHISRDSLNSLGQLVLEMEFLDRAPLIARTDVVFPWRDIVASAGTLAYALSTGTGSGNGGGVHTVVTLPPRLSVLNFDATFLTDKGELQILLGDQLLTSIPASSRGMRQSLQVPIDLREKTRRIGPVKTQNLKFQLTGAPGALVHVANISIRGAHVSSSPTDPVNRWHLDTKGGWAGLVDDTPFPVEVKLLPEKQDQSGAARDISVAILSTKTFNPTKDIERDTLHFAGSSAGREADNKGGSRPRCSERDLNGDGVPDLVCEFAPPAGKSSLKNALLQGMSPYGWMIAGRAE